MVQLTRSTRPKSSDIPAAIRDIVGAKGPDKVIETTGVKEVIEQAYDITHADGTCVLVGVPNEKVTIYTLPIHFNKVLDRLTWRRCCATRRHSAAHTPDKSRTVIVRWHHYA